MKEQLEAIRANLEKSKGLTIIPRAKIYEEAIDEMMAFLIQMAEKLEQLKGEHDGNE